MNINDKKKIVRSSITQAGVPVLFDSVIESSEIYTDPVQVTITENGVTTIKAEDIDREEREAQGLTPYDGMSTIEVTVDVAGGGGGEDPDPLHYHIGDIVMYDAANDKKVKTTKDAYTLEKYPADNFTPIGVIFHVNEDGSARMLALAAMSSTTPDTGSDLSESIPWGGYGFDIPELDNYEGVAVINDQGIVSGNKTSAYVPTYSSIIEVPALDGIRYYQASNAGSYMPSSYNADGSLNPEFFKQTMSDNTYYEWKRQYNGSWYYICTDKPGTEIDENTKLYGYSQGHNSFVPNYGFPSSGTTMTYLGLITDTAIYDGGVANFTTDFTYNDKSFTDPLLANSDMDGAGNTAKILLHQGTNYVFDNVVGGDTVHDGVNMYFWTRHKDSDGKDYWFYTTDEVPTADTEIWIIGQSSSSFNKDYGTVNSNSGTNWIKVGLAGNTSYISDINYFTDGTFTHDSDGLVKYYWQRYNETDGKTYFLYTDSDPEHITDSTKIFIIGRSSSSFVFDYGTVNQYDGSTIYEIGTISDSTKISGGAEGFLAHFTHLYPTPWKTSPTLKKEGYNPANFPAACATWRFHTPGTNQGDWYLPAEGENAIISSNFDFMTESLRVVRTLRPDVKVCGLGTNYYWSSTEYSSNNSWECHYYNGKCINSNKSSNSYVRAVSQVAALS